MHLLDINFPIFSLTKSHKRVWEDMNVLYIETPSGVYIVDNKNIDGDTIGKRRAKMNADNKYIPRKVYYNISQLLHSKDKHFVDNFGTPFKYEKTEFVPLKFHKVIDTKRLEDGDCVVYLEDIYFPQKLNCRLAHSIQYVGVLHTKMGYILYKFSEEKEADTRRKI